MPAPTNISFATATDLTTLPQTITQQADDAGTTYTLYFHVPANLITAAITELGVFGFGDLVTYQPTTRVYQGPVGTPVQIVRATADQPAALNIPLQVPVVVGTDYFITVTPNAGNPTPAMLTLLVQAAPNASMQAGDIVIPDDTAGSVGDSSGFPVVILDPSADHAIRRFINPFSASEQGDVVHDTNSVLMQRDPITPFDVFRLTLYDSAYAVKMYIPYTPAIGNQPPVIRANQTTQTFWVGYFNDPDLYAFSVTPAGIASAVENLGNTFTGISSIAANPDETILYWVERNDSLIKRWDLVNGVMLTDLIARDATHRVVDILVLANGELVIGYWKSTVTRDFNVKHYSAAGVLLHTYSFGSDVNTGSSPRLAHSLDNLTSFWAYLAPDSGFATTGRLIHIYQVQISDGSFLTNRTYMQYRRGVLSGAATATPTAYFGASNSCPFWIAGTSTPPPTPLPNGCPAGLSLQPVAGPPGCAPDLQ